MVYYSDPDYSPIEHVWMPENSHSKQCPHCNEIAIFSQVILAPVETDIEADAYMYICSECKGIKFDFDKICYPSWEGTPPPTEDMPAHIRSLYNEARQIANISPRGSAAISRLAIQELCKSLGGSGRDLNKDIGMLVQKGLPAKIQKALDVVRVVGNKAVHPGVITFDDDSNVAIKLLELINIICEIEISQVKKVERLYEKLSDGVKKQILDRDS